MLSVVGAVLGRQVELSLRGLMAMSRMQLAQAVKSKLCWLPHQHWLRPAVSILSQNAFVTPGFVSSARTKGLMFCSEPAGDRPSGGSSSDGQRSSGPLKLMDCTKIRWPRPLNSIRNYYFAALIKLGFDKEFSMSGFLAGAEQAVSVVSDLVSRGRFEELEGLVTTEVVQEVSRNYSMLSEKQRKFLAVNTNDIALRFIYEIGMIFDDNSERRFVEITTVFQGLHGVYKAKMTADPEFMQNLNRKAAYVCNYRFIREYTKGKEDSWVINQLNHFHPLDMD